MNDSWINAAAYEKFMGRWSTPFAREFLNWLEIPNDSIWLDVGCGTGTLTKLILDSRKPKKVISIDSSIDFISYAKSSIVNPNVHFNVGLAESMILRSNSIDVTVSGLVLNFVSEPKIAVAEMLRVTKPGGVIGIFLWDYAEGMQMLRYFWDAAAELDIKALEFDEGIKFSICREGKLEYLFKEVGLKQVAAKPIELKTIFQNFDDYWQPFLGSVGPAPNYVTSLNEKDKKNLENKIRNSLPVDTNGLISLSAKVWAVKGTV